MADRISYNGSDIWKQRATELLNQGGGGGGSEGSSLSLKGRKFIFIGDSYQEGWSNDGTAQTIIIDSWLDYFISWYGSEFEGYYRNQRGGWGFAKEDCQFITLLQALENTITDKASITDIVVEGGYNDHAWLSGIDSAILAFKTYAKGLYSNATLWIAPVSRGINQYSEDAAEANKRYIDSGMKYGYNICGEITRVMLNESYFCPDLVHPTADGYKQICKYMHQCLTTGACDLLTGLAEEAYIETNYYTKTDIDTALAGKANANSVYTKTEADDLLDDKANASDVYIKSETYSMTQVNNLLDDKQDSLLGGNISSGDLDDYTDLGFYYVSSTSVSNIPVSQGGFLEVLRKDTQVSGAKIQRYTAVSSSNPRLVTGVYERWFISNAWQSWAHIGDNVFLPLTGGELTGDLTVSRLNPRYYLNNTGFKVDSSANNGVTTARGSYVDMTDDADLYTSRIYSEADTNGDINTRIQTRNMMEGSTTRRIATFRITVKKDGNTEFATAINAGSATYTIVNPENFREAIGINDRPVVIAFSSSTQSVATATYTSLVDNSSDGFELTPGTWLISFKAQFASNANGLRRIMITSTKDSQTPWADSRITAHASSNQIIDIGWTTIVRITSTVTRYITAYQNSGSALNVTGFVKAVKIINV